MQFRHVHIVDTTLRDGEQAPGVAFSFAQRRRLLESLIYIGVPEIECGCPAMGADEETALRRLLAYGDTCVRMTAWCRACENDLMAARRCGFQSVHFSFVFSPVLLAVQRKDFASQLQNMQSLLKRALNQFAFVSVGLQDASRTDAAMLVRAVQTAVSAGAHRIRLADTIGIWSPHEVVTCMESIRPLVPAGIKLGVHMHNDYGMATANTLVAAQQGADDVDVTIMGLGERSGNAPLEQVVMAFDRASGFEHGVDTTMLYDLCIQAARYAKRAIPVQQPVCGSAIFRHESGIHAAGQLRNRASYEPYPPEEVGRPDIVDIPIGRHSGTQSLQHAFRIMGIALSKTDALLLLPHVRTESVRRKGSVPHGVLGQLYVNICKEQKEEKR